jgi:hypothetical protein
MGRAGDPLLSDFVTGRLGLVRLGLVRLCLTLSHLCLRPCEAEIRLYFESVVCSASASPQGLSKIEREGNREETECWKAADVTLQCTRGDPKTVRQREETDPLWANANRRWINSVSHQVSRR